MGKPLICFFLHESHIVRTQIMDASPWFFFNNDGELLTIADPRRGTDARLDTEGNTKQPPFLIKRMRNPAGSITKSIARGFTISCSQSHCILQALTLGGALRFNPPFKRANLFRCYKRCMANILTPEDEISTIHRQNTGEMTSCGLVGDRVWYSSTTSTTRQYRHSFELTETGEKESIAVNTHRTDQRVREQ